MDAIRPVRRNNVHVRGASETARAMVFVHGFGTDQTAWRDVAASFEPDWKIVLLDNVGGGDTPPEAFAQHQYLDLHRYAEDLRGVCSELGLRRVVLVGHSMGAMICALAVAADPELGAQLVLVAGSPRYLDEPGYRGGFTRKDLDEVYRAMDRDYREWANASAPLIMGNPGQPHLAKAFADTLKSIPADRALTVLCSILQSDHRGRLAEIRCPTLIVQSRSDPFVPREVAEYMQRAIAGSALRVIDVEGHLPHVSAPASVAAAIREFVTQE